VLRTREPKRIRNKEETDANLWGRKNNSIHAKVIIEERRICQSNKRGNREKIRRKD